MLTLSRHEDQGSLASWYGQGELDRLRQDRVGRCQLVDE